MHATVNRIQLIESILEEITVLEDAIAFTSPEKVVKMRKNLHYARHELYKQRNQRLKRFSDGQLRTRCAKLLLQIQWLAAGKQPHHEELWERDAILEEIQTRNLLKEYKS